MPFDALPVTSAGLASAAYAQLLATFARDGHAPSKAQGPRYGICLNTSSLPLAANLSLPCISARSRQGPESRARCKLSLRP
jgi:hypothetical protein